MGVQLGGQGDPGWFAAAAAAVRNVRAAAGGCHRACQVVRMPPSGPGLQLDPG
ncbi:MAG TPA: hypothetical protein VE888_25950 [Streptosporangiaceae bacterium]|nr:hypothetical protein [Streptosporangiaceae bacterium]